MNIMVKQNLFGSNFPKANFEKHFVDKKTNEYNLQNIFDNPQKYLNEIKNVVIPVEKRKEFNGKTLLCVWLTKLCPAKCECCFFRSDMNHNCKFEEEYQFTDDGVDKLINFINDSNNSYIMLSGGGDPMVHRNGVNRVIRDVKSDRIVIVTSGFWAKSFEEAQERIDEVYKMYKQRDSKTTVVFRISIDSFHCKQLGYDILPNILKIFNEKHSNEENFLLQIHTIINDDTVKNIIDKCDDFVYEENEINCASDNNEVAKIVPRQAKIISKSGYSILVGKAKMFYASLRADLTKYNSNIEKAIDVFEEDMKDSEYGNPAVVTNYDGTYGLDFWIDYNGNTTTWGNQQLDDLYNIYTDSFYEIYNGITKNIISYSFLDRGYYYRENIVKEINPRAVLKSKVINLRDFASALLLEENDTKLYYGIRIIQDYLKDGKIELKDLGNISPELVRAIFNPVDELKKLYNNSDYDILLQYFSNADCYTKEEWEDIFLLIKLDHFDIKPSHLDVAIKYYNIKFGTDYKQLSDFPDAKNIIQYVRLHKRIAYMKNEAYEYIRGINNKVKKKEIDSKK